MLLLARVYALMMLLSSAQAVTNKVDLSCHKSVGGSWNFGAAPSGCDVSPLASPQGLHVEFSSVFFEEAGTVQMNRTKYMSAMYPVLRDLGSYYIRRRNPSVSDAEVAGFQDGLFALAEQETYWTHFRMGGDQVLRYMRGDSLHGHGFMQIDDRSHAAFLNQGKGVDLVYNILYGLDIYYAGWVKSGHAHCVSSASNYKDRARAAWAAYNGGPSSLCRWTSNGQTDRDFQTRYTQKRWLSFVKSVSVVSPLDVRCLAEGPRPCMKGTTGVVAPIVAKAAMPVLLSQPTYVLKSDKAYVALRQCGSQDCAKESTLLHGKKRDQVALSGEVKGEWAKVQLVNREGSGWLMVRDLEPAG